MNLTVITSTNPEQARALAETLQCSCDDLSAAIQLVFHQGALSVQFKGDDAILNGCLPILFSFSDYDMTSQAGADPKQNLFRACGIHKKSSQRILDCCAGTGGDAFMLHSQGAEILSCERDPIVFQLLQDVMQREIRSDKWTLLQQDACTYIADQSDLSCVHDIIYIDPMFRSERKRRAAEGKLMRALRYIAGDDLDSEELVEVAALSTVPVVVLKRPLRSQAMNLPQRHCNNSIKGKGHRLDVYRL